MDYKKIYTTLYSEGYHITELTNIGKEIVGYITDNFEFETILDVGCSQGLAVSEYRKKGRNSFGIDVSEIAIEKAKELSGNDNCKWGSVLDIPFSDNTFDAIVSTDVLEHLQPEDALKGLSEINRVASKYLFLKISKSKEGRTDWIDLLKKKYPDLVKGVDNLHLSVFPLETWTKWIEDMGKFKLKQKFKNILVFESLI